MRTTPTTNAGSMADIAFTLLIFFLVTTTMATDKGQRVLLPPWIECENPVDCEDEVSEKELFTIEIIANDEILVENKKFLIEQLKDETITFLLNNNENPLYSTSYEKALVYIKTNQQASYSSYLEVYSHVREAFTEIRNKEALTQYGKNYEFLPNQQASEIRKKFPLKIAEQIVR